MVNGNIISALTSIAKEHREDRDPADFVKDVKSIDGVRDVKSIDETEIGGDRRYEIVGEDGNIIVVFPNDVDWWQKCTSSIAYLQTANN